MARHAAHKPASQAGKFKIPREPADPRLGRNPYQVLSLLAMVLSSSSLMLFGPSPSSAIIDLPTPILVVFAVMTIIGAVICIVGVYLKDMMWAAWTEAAGQAGIMGPLALYVIDLLKNVQNWSSGLGAGLELCILLACGVRLFQLGRWVHWVITRPAMPHIPTIPLPQSDIDDAIEGLAQHYGDAHQMGSGS